jgi:hypothetical protein
MHERTSQLLFEALDGLGQGRLGRVTLFGRAGEVQGLCQGEKVADLAEFHRKLLHPGVHGPQRQKHSLPCYCTIECQQGLGSEGLCKKSPSLHALERHRSSERSRLDDAEDTVARRRASRLLRTTYFLNVLPEIGVQRFKDTFFGKIALTAGQLAGHRSPPSLECYAL